MTATLPLTSDVLRTVSCVTTPKRPQPIPERGAGEGLKSVATALDVLKCFAVDDELGVSDIARRLGIAKSTAHRLLTTLCSRGMTEKNPESGLYRLGMHLFELGQLAQARLRLRQLALPMLGELRAVTGHTVHLGVADGADVVHGLGRVGPALGGPRRDERGDAEREANDRGGFGHDCPAAAAAMPALTRLILPFALTLALALEL